MGKSSAFGVLLRLAALSIAWSTCANTNAMGGTNWKEEVRLHDGRKIVAERWVKRGGRHEIGQEASYSEQSLRFTLPGSREVIQWKDQYSEDIGTANFLPMLLDVRDTTVYLVAYPMGCLSYNKWRRPNPPYVVFKYDHAGWRRIPLTELPEVIKTPNLIFSNPDKVAAQIGKGLIPADTIDRIISGYAQPEFKTIMREPVPNVESSCGEMIYDGKGGWHGVGWFRDQPSYEACLKYCGRHKIEASYCPCVTYFQDR